MMSWRWSIFRVQESDITESAVVMDERPVCAVSGLLLSLISSHDESAATAVTAAAAANQPRVVRVEIQ